MKWKVQCVTTKLGDFMGKIEKIRILTKDEILAIFHKKWFFQNHADKDSFLRNEYEIFSSGTSIWYLKICNTDFWISDCFWNMADCVHLFGHFANPSLTKIF